MGISVAVVGASGYAGGELLRLLSGHPEFRVTTAVAQRLAGRSVGDVHPQLASLADVPLRALAEADLDSADLVFLALPHGTSATVASTIGEGGSRVVDLGADFRLAAAADWSRWYSGGHAGVWTYGLPELPGARPAIRDSTRVANPGCYATAITLALAPLMAAGLFDEGVSGTVTLSVVAASGVSGAGRSPTERLLGAETMSDLSVYKTGRAHQHIPEIEQALRSAMTTNSAAPVVSMTPMLAPMPRGILAVCSGAAAPGVDTGSVTEVLRASYDDEPFVTVLPEGQTPRTSAVIGSNSVALQAFVEPDTDLVVVISAIDNLGKGAAGQAIQNANLMFGLDEAVGLPRDGVAP
jgi:N-acetyl-gamma-glutamyl-phosphate reductase